MPPSLLLRGGASKHDLSPLFRKGLRPKRERRVPLLSFHLDPSAVGER
jgi:hypothetical protein